MANVFDRSYRFYEAGAPFPGTCLACSNTENLWDLGIIRGTNQGAYFCHQCLESLNFYVGFVAKNVHEAAIKELTDQNTELANQLNAAPKLIKELTQNVNNLLGDFVTGLASVASPSKPVQPESVEASTGSVAASDDVKPAVGEAKGQGAKSGAKSSSK